MRNVTPSYLLRFVVAQTSHLLTSHYVTSLILTPQHTPSRFLYLSPLIPIPSKKTLNYRDSPHNDALDLRHYPNKTFCDIFIFSVFVTLQRRMATLSNYTFFLLVNIERHCDCCWSGDDCTFISFLSLAFVIFYRCAASCPKQFNV